MNELALFAGTGGGILGGRLLGWRTVCAVEYDKYARSVLMARQNDGSLEPFPIWDDVRTFDGRDWNGCVDVVSGGFPCTDISSAGKGAGIEGEQSGLWKEMARIIGEVRPRFVFVENSPMLATGRGLHRVLGDLSSLGFNDAEWGVLGAHHTGAPHKRDRIWITARNTNSNSEPTLSVDDEASRLSSLATDADRKGLQGQRELASRISKTLEDPSYLCWWEVEPDVGRVANGVAHRVDRLKAIGNGQVPSVAALAFNTLRRRLEERM
jgi:DNA (cytosine-5)-methyltransferase 1